MHRLDEGSTPSTSTMKVIFLDIDGVINNAASIRKKGLHTLDPGCVTRLNRLLDETGAILVISSTWRKIWPLAALQCRFEEYGFTGKIADRTPVLRGVERGVEIASYLSEMSSRGYPIEQWVILDDNSDMGPLAYSLLLIDREPGLTDQDVEKAKEILDGTPTHNFLDS